MENLWLFHRSVATRGGGLQAALTLLKDFEVDVRRYASVCISNMANFPTTQVQILVHGGLASLLALAKDDLDSDSQRQALMCLVNLSSNETNHSALFDKGAVAILLAQATESHDAAVREHSGVSRTRAPRFTRFERFEKVENES